MGFQCCFKFPSVLGKCHHANLHSGSGFAFGILSHCARYISGHERLSHAQGVHVSIKVAGGWLSCPCRLHPTFAAVRFDGGLLSALAPGEEDAISSPRAASRFIRDTGCAALQISPIPRDSSGSVQCRRSPQSPGKNEGGWGGGWGPRRLGGVPMIWTQTRGEGTSGAT